MSKKELRAKLEEQTHLRLELEDKLNDIESGLEIWRNQKIDSGEWTAMDEMLERWLTHG